VVEIFRPHIRERLTSALGALFAIGIVTTACCAGCGTKNVNNCPGDVGSSTRCEIVVGGGSPPGSVPSDGSAPGASAGGSAPATGAPPGSSATADPEPSAGSSGPPAVKAVSLLVPIVSQPGWTLVWSGQKSIGPQGVIFSHVNPASGPETGTGDDFDLQYLAPGSGNGWGSGLNHLYYWTNNYKPGPATIAGMLQNQNFSGQNPVGMVAHVGDRLFAAMDTEAEGFNIAFYMQVTKVEVDSVLVDLWIWDST
jgi:hypothetical protein